MELHGYFEGIEAARAELSALSEVLDRCHEAAIGRNVSHGQRMTEEHSELVARYLPLIDAEMRRIGFTDEDLSYLGSGGTLTQELCEKHLADLRQIPSHIGAIAYYAKYSVDFAAIERDVDRMRNEGFES